MGTLLLAFAGMLLLALIILVPLWLAGVLPPPRLPHRNQRRRRATARR
jgi:hypothetical protein